MFVLDNDYTLAEVCRTAYSLILTRLWYPGARLIRRPFNLRGKLRFVYGTGFTTGYGCRIEALCSKKGDKTPRIELGANVHIGDHVHIVAKEHVSIGDDCLFASKVFISDCGHGSYSHGEESTPYDHPESRRLAASPVSIGKRVWLGENVCVLAGSSIGDGAIVGANAVVTGDIPSNSIAVGAPARVIKRFDDTQGRWVAC